MKNVMEYFPLKEARPTQKLVLEETERVFSTGKKIVILEAPVGSGKSAIALTLARQQAAHPETKFEDAKDGKPVKPPPMPVHIITPRKSLQDQYYADFPRDLVTMKGRNSYPCIIEMEPRRYIPILKAIKEGKTAAPGANEDSCANGPCDGNEEIYKSCTDQHPCPYNLAIETAQGEPIIVHNLHSFIYQTSFATKFDKRSLLIVDEAHEIENTVRNFATRTLHTKAHVDRSQVDQLVTIKDWTEFLLKPEIMPVLTPQDISKAAADPKFKSVQAVYKDQVAQLEKWESTYEKGFAVEIIPTINVITKARTGTRFEIIPNYVGGEVRRLLLEFGDRVLLMSGTIYDKKTYCSQLGINPEDAHFIRIESTFPKENRPIYLKPAYQVNTSHATWNENFPKMIEIIQAILAIFHDAKGLIHAPSYFAAEEIAKALNSPRVWTHQANNFLTTLERFFASSGNGIFLSPICQQGVDFKEDRARFQIVVRVPYLSTGSAFVADKLKKDFQWYNYQALIVFGQQVGRVNRGPDDYGATFLLDSRFSTFISKNRGVLPKWLKDGFIYK